MHYCVMELKLKQTGEYHMNMKKLELINKISKLNSQQLMTYQMMKKSTASFFFLAWFLGGLGIEWFYVGKKLQGWLSVAFFWTFIPGIISFFAMFLSSKIVSDYNSTILDQLLATNINN